MPASVADRCLCKRIKFARAGVRAELPWYPVNSNVAFEGEKKKKESGSRTLSDYTHEVC